MTWVTIVGFLKAVLPTKRIAAWILGLLCAVLALFMGVNNSELKAQFCSTAEVVTIPAVPVAPPPSPAAVVAPVAAPKK